MLQDQVAIITGGSKGIGAAIAHRLAIDGIKLILVARHSQNLDKMARSLETQTEVVPVPADITIETDIKKIVGAAIERFGRIDILVNNAGQYIEKPFVECTTDDIDTLIGTDLRGMFLLTREVIPHMIKQKFGTIINLSSEMGLVGVKNQAVHCACKFAIVGFSQSLFHELKSHNIRVSFLCPNATNTWGAEISANYLRPEDVAEVVHFVLGADSNNVVAQVVFRSLQSLDP